MGSAVVIPAANGPDNADVIAIATQAKADLDKAFKYLKLPCRGVVTANVASLAAFVGVAGGTPQDGVTYAAGDRVLLAGQTSGLANGPYVVGVVGGGVAPLTRAPDHAAGDTFLAGHVIEVSEGTVWANSTWKATKAGAGAVDTDDPLYYPRVFKKTITLASGTYTIGFGGGGEPLYLLSTTTSMVDISRNTAGGTTTATLEYGAVGASRIAGKAGTAVVVVQAEVAAGTLNNADNSTLDVVVTNF